ncbi:MAG: transcriptional regulator, TetR family [Rubritepida sp.]|nr:transcriptional regulator, TetR family [Rubritepida sp.]
MAETGLTNQKRRTRKDLLQAATRLIRQGRTPTLEEVAEEALVSRATIYRYFPSVEQLLLEASFDVATPSPEALFQGLPSDDAAGRLERVDTVLHDMTLAHEGTMRLVLAHLLQHAGEEGVPPRQNRRSPLIEAALAPAAGQFTPEALDRLAKAVALVMGPEAMIVVKDVLQLDEAEGRAVKHWAIRAMVEAARRGDG